ncbi:MAG: hypothetical protein AAFO01_00875 [Pseudomonadota bacterium]
MPELIIAEHHEQVYSVWQDRGMHDLKLAHVDFHCDMRGILIDRRQGRAFFTSHSETTYIDRGNFLAHAVMMGIVTDLRWVHDQHGGRGYDSGPVVSYETDLLAPYYRHVHRRSGRKDVPLTFRESLLDDWEGLRPGEQLDLDWDALASIEYEPSLRKSLAAHFLERDFEVTPDVTFLVYSPGYSDPDRSFFEGFAQQLAGKFNADITRLPKAELNTEGKKYRSGGGWLRKSIPSPLRTMKKNLMQRWRHFETGRDIEHFRQSP